MDGVPSKNTNRHFARKAVLLVFVILAVAAAALLGGRLLWHWGGYADWGSVSGLHGQLTMTMTAAGLVAPYVFDFDKGKLARQGRTAGVFLLQATAASSTGDVAYRCTSAAGVPQVCTYDPTTGSHEVVSHNDYRLKRYLAWSPDETSILYVASLASTTPPSPDPNDWAVFLARADGGTEKQIAKGSAAFFSPDGASVYSLEKDGLHEHGLASRTDKVVWPVTGGSANRFMTLAVSPDSTKLAWSNPYSGTRGQGKLSLFSVVSWHPFTLRYDAAVPLRIWQMQFSPDGRALVLSADSSDGTPGLYGYVLGGEPKKVQDLQAYERKTFISEWR